MAWAVDCAAAYGLGWRREFGVDSPGRFDIVWPRALNWLVYLIAEAVESANSFLEKSVNGLDPLAFARIAGKAWEVAAELANWFVYRLGQECRQAIVRPGPQFTRVVIEDVEHDVLPGGRKSFWARERVTAQLSTYQMPTGAVLTLNVVVNSATLSLSWKGRRVKTKLRNKERIEILGALAQKNSGVLGPQIEIEYHNRSFVSSPIGDIQKHQVFVATSRAEVWIADCNAGRPADLVLEEGETIEFDLRRPKKKLTIGNRQPIVLTNGVAIEVAGGLVCKQDGKETATQGDRHRFHYQIESFIDGSMNQSAGERRTFVGRTPIEVKFVRHVDSLTVIRGEDMGTTTVKLVEGGGNLGREVSAGGTEEVLLDGRMSVAECRCGGSNCRDAHSLRTRLSFPATATLASIVATGVHGIPKVAGEEPQEAFERALFVKSFEASMYYAYLADGCLEREPGEEPLADPLPAQIRKGLVAGDYGTRQIRPNEPKEYQGALDCLVFCYPHAPLRHREMRRCTAGIQYQLRSGAAVSKPCGCLNPPNSTRCDFCGNRIDHLRTTTVWESSRPGTVLIGFEDYFGGGPDGREGDAEENLGGDPEDQPPDGDDEEFRERGPDGRDLDGGDEAAEGTAI
jgi:hypothetical protein